MGKLLMVDRIRFLPLYVLISIFVSVIAAQPAHAKLGPISVRSVYTTDENFNNKIVFMPGDRINYHVDVDNTTGSTFPVDIRFQVFTAFNLNPTLYGYDQTYHVDQMAVGWSRFYTPVTLPSNAAIHLGYILRITITPSGCSGTGCTNDGDFGENRFSIQTTKAPEGKASNLIVIVHGCCTDKNDVEQVWGNGTPGNPPGMAKVITDNIQSQTNKDWEVVVWDWHEYTPKHLEYITCLPGCLVQDADAAYEAAKGQGAILANAIKLYSDTYKHIHLIGHSAGSKLIHDAATAYINDFFIRQKNPFIHLTFLDAYTPNEWDQKGEGSYGSLPTNYPYHYSEHYVDRGLLLTDACLENAFNFDITTWRPDKDDRPFEFGHQWPHRWYKKSVTPLFSGYQYGYALSLEGNNKRFDAVARDFPPGQQCTLSDNGTSCKPALCRVPGSF